MLVNIYTYFFKNHDIKETQAKKQTLLVLN